MPFIIAGLVIADQAVWTLRYQLINRGGRRMGSILGVLNAAIAVTAVAQVINNLDQPANILGYAIGVGVGTYLGSVVEERVVGGAAQVTAVTDGDGTDLVDSLRSLGWPATAFGASGTRGRAAVLFVMADRARVPLLVDQIETLQPSAFVSVTDVSRVRPVPLPDGLIQVAPSGRARSLLGRFTHRFRATVSATGGRP